MLANIAVFSSCVSTGDLISVTCIWWFRSLRTLTFLQKIRSTAYSNFSVVTLTVVFILGGVIIIIGNTLEDLVFWIEKHRKITKYSRLEWSMNDSFQMQRVAHEELGIGVWEGCAGTHCIPTLKDKEQPLAIIDTQDPGHPRLKVPSTVSNTANGKIETVDNSNANVESDNTIASHENSSTIDHEELIGKIESNENGDAVDRLENAKAMQNHRSENSIEREGSQASLKGLKTPVIAKVDRS